METRSSCRKRRNSATSILINEPPVSHRTRQAAGTVTEHIEPKQQETRSTGLTPAMKRTSFEPSKKFAQRGNQTPSRSARRRSAPLPRFQRAFDSVQEYDESSLERVYQFTPLRQILDCRTQRRIRRIGLSDEITQIEREKRESRNFEKTLSSLRHERDELQRELNSMKQRDDLEDCQPSDESYWMSSQGRVQQPEPERAISPEGISVASDRDQNEPFQYVDGDTFTLNDSAIIISNSPDLRAMRDYNTPEPDSLMYGDESTIINVATQTSFTDNPGNSDMHNLTLDLEAARSEKEKLFNKCRSQISAFEDSSMGDILRLPSPPQDFFDNIVSILTTALSRAADATEALEGINEEFSSLGFSGATAEEVVSDIKSHFRSARLELERAIPGETAGVSLANGKATLGTLVQRVRSLAKDLQTERKHHHGSLGREKALRGQFDNLLHRYEAAANKIGNLEDSIASSARDMLHTRMRLQDLENEDQEKTIGIDRLNTALDRYHEDMKSLENLVNRLEDENVTVKAQYKQQIAKLKQQVASERQQRSDTENSASEYETRVRLLEETVELNRIKACDLMAQVECLEKEQRVASNTLDRKASEELQHHEQETGTLNVRISELNTSLDEAKCEADRLRQVNIGLEEQLQIETEARDEMLDKWAAEQARSFAFMKESVGSERRRAKARAANWELKSDDLMSDGTTVMGSEPITPVSMTRFVDVEYGRGKNRRRIDSGVGILTKEGLLSEDVPGLRAELDSDPDLPTLDLIGA
ncbi:unnamed protein product [Penicillium manginii]